MKFKAQVKQVQSRITASGDKEFIVKLVTENPEAFTVGLLPHDELVEVEIQTAK